MAIIIRTIFEELEKEAISTELIQLPDVHIKPCRITQGKDCLACMGKDNCVFKDDDFYEIFVEYCINPKLDKSKKINVRFIKEQRRKK